MGLFVPKLKGIKAKFIGNSSCGFISGFVYHINIYTDDNNRYVWVRDLNGSGCCPYRSIKTLAENWEIPIKDEFIENISIRDMPVSDNWMR